MRSFLDRGACWLYPQASLLLRNPFTSMIVWPTRRMPSWTNRRFDSVVQLQVPLLLRSCSPWGLTILAFIAIYWRF
jgi:hypothetical protein